MIDRAWWSDIGKKPFCARTCARIHYRITVINKHWYIYCTGIRGGYTKVEDPKELHRGAFELIIWCRLVWIIQVSANGMSLEGRNLHEKQKSENGIAFWFITSTAERNVYFFNFSTRNSCSLGFSDLFPSCICR